MNNKLNLADSQQLDTTTISKACNMKKKNKSISDTNNEQQMQHDSIHAGVALVH